MRVMAGRMVFAATDRMRFMGCAHATILDLAHLQGRGPQPRADSEDAALLQRQGDAHEQRHLTRLQAAGGVIEITRGDLAANAETTRDALATGHDVVRWCHRTRCGGPGDVARTGGCAASTTARSSTFTLVVA